MHTAGKSKAMLDPFRPENPEDVERLKGLQRRIHDVFVDLVRERRGEKLNDSYDDLFSGAFWVGAEALDLGLVDGLGDIRTILRQRFGDKVQFRMIEPARPPLLGRLLGRRSLGQSSLIDPARDRRRPRGAGRLGAAGALKLAVIPGASGPDNRCRARACRIRKGVDPARSGPGMTARAPQRLTWAARHPKGSPAIFETNRTPT